MAAIAANAQKVLVSTEQFNIAEDGSESSWGVSSVKYYDKNGVNSLEISTYSKMLYTYNENGSMATKTYYSWNTNAGWQLDDYNCATYEYDAEGNLLKVLNGSGSYTVYADYKYGEFGKMDNFDKDGNSTYSVTYDMEFDSANRIVKRDQLMADGSVNQRTTYTYDANGRLASDRTVYVGADGSETMPTENTYVYNADGTVASYTTVSDSRWGLTTYKYVNKYVEMSASYVPQNVKAEAGENNTMTVTWDAVAGATAYVVLYDQQADTVTTTTLTTPSLLDGTHDVYVQAIVNGEGRNISDVASATVKDEGKLPALNFEVVSTEMTQDDYGNIAYNVTVKFTLPETSSTITGYNLFYGEGSYDNTSIYEPTVEGNAVTATVTLSQYAVCDYDYDIFEYVPRTSVPLSVVLVYASGNAEASNVVRWNFAENVTGIANVADAEGKTPVAYYTVGGVKSSVPQKGISIVKYSDGSVQKVLVK